MKQKPGLKCIFGTIVIIALAIGAYFIIQNTKSNQAARIFDISKNAPAGPGNPLPGPIGCTTQNPWVMITAPVAGAQYVSGQGVNVTWSKCGVSTNTTGTLRLTRVSGTGPAIYGPFAITGAQSSYTVPIATLPGIYNGNNAINSMYTATVTYGTIMNTSGPFTITQSPLGLQIQYGNYYFGTTGNGNSEVYFEQWAPLKAMGGDIYLDKDTVYNSTATTGAQTTTIKEFYVNTGYTQGAPAPLDAQIAIVPVLSPATGGVTLLPGGTYKIPAGTIAQFKITTRVVLPTGTIAPYKRWVDFYWTGFSFATTDTNGNLYEPAYNNLGRYGFLQKF